MDKVKTEEKNSERPGFGIFRLLRDLRMSTDLFIAERHFPGLRLLTELVLNDVSIAYITTFVRSIAPTGQISVFNISIGDCHNIKVKVKEKKKMC